MKQIQKSASHINLMFLIALLPWLIACTFMIGKATASPLDCRIEWNNWFFQKIDPTIQKQCGKKFEYFTRLEIKTMNNFANFR